MPVKGDSSREQLLEYVGIVEVGFEALFSALATNLPPLADVTSSMEVIKGVDGNDIACSTSCVQTT